LTAPVVQQALPSMQQFNQQVIRQQASSSYGQQQQQQQIAVAPSFIRQSQPSSSYGGY
jgi:hypothetical protein